jgi:hypothetical protein
MSHWKVFAAIPRGGDQQEHHCRPRERPPHHIYCDTAVRPKDHGGQVESIAVRSQFFDNTLRLPINSMG